MHFRTLRITWDKKKCLATFGVGATYKMVAYNSKNTHQQQKHHLRKTS